MSVCCCLSHYRLSTGTFEYILVLTDTTVKSIGRQYVVVRAQKEIN